MYGPFVLFWILIVEAYGIYNWQNVLSIAITRAKQRVVRETRLELKHDVFVDASQRVASAFLIGTTCF